MSTFIKKQAVQPIIDGFNMVANATKLSMGYEGKFAFLEDKMGVFRPTKDGVTIARSVFAPVYGKSPKDQQRQKSEDIGCQLGKQICAKQVIQTGDSTTAAIVFAQHLINAGHHIINKEYSWFETEILGKRKVSSVEFRKGMELALEDFKTKLPDFSNPVNTPELVEAIAAISANNDEEIGETLAEAYREVGPTGIIEIETAKGEATTTKTIKGMRVDRGMKSPFFANTEKGTAELDTPYVFLFEGFVQDLRIITEVLQKSVTDNRPLLLVADDYSEDALALLQNNFERGAMQVCPIRCPDFGTKRKHLLEDIAAFTGTEVFTQGISKEMKLGTARKITVGKETTEISQDVLFEGVEARVSGINAQLEDSPEDPEFLQQRLASLSASVAVIFVGDKSDAARSEKKDRYEDAKHAITSSIAEGCVAGGGSALVYIAAEMGRKFSYSERDRRLGYETLREALYAPFITIMENADLNPHQYLGHIEDEYGVGFNLKTKRMESLLDANILDSAKSLRLALENALSVSSLVLNTQITSTV